MLKQVVVLLVFLSVFNFGRLEQCNNDVERIKNILFELVPFMKEIKNTMNNFLQVNLTNFNESLHQLSAQLEEHKNQTAAELAQLQTSIHSTQFSLDTTTQYLQNVTHQLINIDDRIEEHKNQTAAELAQLQTSIHSTQSSLDTKLEKLANDFFEHQSETEDQLQTTTQYLQNNLTQQLVSIDDRIEEHKKQTAAELAQLQTSIHSTQSSLDIKLELLVHNFYEHQSETEDQLQTTTEYLQNNLTQQLKDINAHIGQLPVYTCGGTGGWRRVVYLNMTDPTSTCPSGWNITGYSKRTCGRATSTRLSCDSVTFPVSGGEYSKICGQIAAYQCGLGSEFSSYSNGQVTTIDGAYVSGVSLTHGSPRQHIWTFAAGASENDTRYSNHICSCDSNDDTNIPPFVGEDYFCESGLHEQWNGQYIFYSNDTLWDGENCLPSSSCCSLHGPPYFVKELSALTTDDIEARICLYHRQGTADIAVQLVELYVK